MYKPHSATPKKFGSRSSAFKTPARRSFGGKFRFSGKKFNNSKPRFKGNKNKNRSRGERIDFSRFVKKNTYMEEKPYVSKNSFTDFSFNPQLHKNITRARFINPRPIQDQAIPVILAGQDVFGLANTGTGKTAAFLLPLIEKISKTKGQNKKETVLIMA